MRAARSRLISRRDLGLTLTASLLYGYVMIYLKLQPDDWLFWTVLYYWCANLGEFLGEYF